MSKHNFIESTDKFGEFYRLIYCTWCGMVVWNFNASDESVVELQKRVGETCIPDEAQPKEEVEE